MPRCCKDCEDVWKKANIAYRRVRVIVPVGELQTTIATTNSWLLVLRRKFHTDRVNTLHFEVAPSSLACHRQKLYRQ